MLIHRPSVQDQWYSRSECRGSRWLKNKEIDKELTGRALNRAKAERAAGIITNHEELKSFRAVAMARIAVAGLGFMWMNYYVSAFYSRDPKKSLAAAPDSQRI